MVHDGRRRQQGSNRRRAVARRWSRCALAAAGAACLAAGAAEPAGSAAAWREDCASYVDVLRGGAGGEDMELSYCIGQTAGITSALLTGSQIGAVSMASALAVAFQLDGDEVFRLFRERTAQSLLGVCPPENARTSEQVLIVYRYLEEHPDKGALAAPAVFFEALSSAYPCASAPPPDSPPP
jgi:hypothetical protein